MWSYYGSKSKVVHLYPRPECDKIIEPFAGTARYALRYFDRDVLLVDKYEVIVRIWKWLQQCSPQDVLKLPRIKWGERVSDYKYDCLEAQWLMGFLVGKGLETPRDKATARATIIRPNNINFQLKRIATYVPKIKHWDIRLGDYRDIPNERATWFIDPPYQVGGDTYKHNQIDYAELAEWAKCRRGQVIVCENTNADWMQFLPIAKMKGSIHTTTEALWTNRPTHYAIQQLALDMVGVS